MVSDVNDIALVIVDYNLSGGLAKFSGLDYSNIYQHLSL